MNVKRFFLLLLVSVCVHNYCVVYSASISPSGSTTQGSQTKTKLNTSQVIDGQPLTLTSGSLQPGIKIISATYGAPGTPGKDVTELLQKQIKPDATSVTLSNATVPNAGLVWQAALFGDPAFGVVKVLNVTWQAAQDTLPSLINKLPHGRAVYIKQNSSGKYLKAVYNKNKGKWTVSFDGTKQDVNTKFFIYKFEDDDAICFTKPFTQGTEKIHLMINFDGITQKLDLIGARNDPTCQWKVLGKSLSDCMLLNFDVQEQIEVVEQNIKDCAENKPYIYIASATWGVYESWPDVTPQIQAALAGLLATSKDKTQVTFSNQTIGSRREDWTMWPSAARESWQTKIFWFGVSGGGPLWGTNKTVSVWWYPFGGLPRNVQASQGDPLTLKVTEEEQKKHPGYALPPLPELQQKLEILKKASIANMNMSLELATPKKSQKTSDDSTVTSDEASN